MNSTSKNFLNNIKNISIKYHKDIFSEMPNLSYCDSNQNIITSVDIFCQKYNYSYRNFKNILFIESKDPTSIPSFSLDEFIFILDEVSSAVKKFLASVEGLRQSYCIKNIMQNLSKDQVIQLHKQGLVTDKLSTKIQDFVFQSVSEAYIGDMYILSSRVKNILKKSSPAILAGKDVSNLVIKYSDPLIKPVPISRLFNPKIEFDTPISLANDFFPNIRMLNTSEKIKFLPSIELNTLFTNQILQSVSSINRKISVYSEFGNLNRSTNTDNITSISYKKLPKEIKINQLQGVLENFLPRQFLLHDDKNLLRNSWSMLNSFLKSEIYKRSYQIEVGLMPSHLQLCLGIIISQNSIGSISRLVRSPLPPAMTTNKPYLIRIIDNGASEPEFQVNIWTDKGWRSCYKVVTSSVKL